MTEYELITLMTEARARGWQTIIIWSALSLSYLALIKLYNSNISAWSAAMASLIYCAFSAFMFSTLSSAHDAAAACEASLKAFDTLSPATQAFFSRQGGGLAELASLVFLAGMFLFTLLALPLRVYKTG